MKSLLSVLAILTAIPAFGKVTVFSGADVLKHILNSKELTKALQPGEKLNGMEFDTVFFNNAKVGKPEVAVGETYSFLLYYTNHGRGTCAVGVSVENKKVLAPNNIVANELGEPILQIDCQ
jgi:hypothetical protein